MSRAPASVKLTTELSEANHITAVSTVRRVGPTIKVVHLATRLTLAGVGNVVASLVRGLPSPHIVQLFGVLRKLTLWVKPCVPRGTRLWN